jgi:hypothetical protein
MTDTDHSSKNHDPVLVIHDEDGAENFVMRRPLTAIAVAMLAGALAARFLSGRASAPRNHS